MIPRETTVLHVEEELVGAEAWAARHGVELEWVKAALELRAVFTHPVSAERFFLRGVFDDYRYVPPLWTFNDSDWGGASLPANYPRVQQPLFGSSVFIMHGGTPVICAPFNRLAYAEMSGPHNDWQAASNWLTAGQAGQIKAYVIGDMLQGIHRDFLHSDGRLG